MDAIISTLKLSIYFYTAMPYNHFMEFIEATLFTRLVYTYLTDDNTLVYKVICSNFLNLERSFQVRVVSENFVGQCLAQAKEAVLG